MGIRRGRSSRLCAAIVGYLSRRRRCQACGRMVDAISLLLCDGVCGRLRYACMRWLRSNRSAGLGLRYETGRYVIVGRSHLMYVDIARGGAKAE